MDRHLVRAIGGGAAHGPFELTLRQTGPKVAGEVRLSGGFTTSLLNGPIEGTITGDVLRFGRPDGRLSGEAIVAGDELSGTVILSLGGGHTMALRLQRQP